MDATNNGHFPPDLPEHCSRAKQVWLVCILQASGKRESSYRDFFQRAIYYRISQCAKNLAAAVIIPWARFALHLMTSEMCMYLDRQGAVGLVEHWLSWLMHH